MHILGGTYERTDVTFVFSHRRLKRAAFAAILPQITAHAIASLNSLLAATPQTAVKPEEEARKEVEEEITALSSAETSAAAAAAADGASGGAGAAAAPASAPQPMQTEPTVS